MSVGKTVIAEVEQISVETVCCKNCGSSKEVRHGYYYCKAWQQRINNAEKDYCSFFYVEEDN